MKSLQKLIASLKRLPGIGPKQAERLAIYLLRSPQSETESLILALREAKAAIHPCPQCWDFTDRDLCRICSDPARDRVTLCVVEEPQDVVAIERAGFDGLYHVLHGSLSPMDGIGPERLRLRELVERVKTAEPPLGEVILATDPDTEGEATALYIGQLLKAFPGLKVSRIAHGVPLGGDLDYIDERTLSHAMAGRREL